MAEIIALYTRQLILVDFEDYLIFGHFNWNVVDNKIKYAVRNYLGKNVYLHRDIMSNLGYDINGKDVDHINGNGLDNRRSNLRVVTHGQNLYNSKKSKNNTSGVTGVKYCYRNNKWVSRINFECKEINLGSYLKFEDAVIARKVAEKTYFGEYARQVTA